MARHGPSGCSDCSCKADASGVLETLIAAFHGPRSLGAEIVGVDYFVLTKRIGVPRAKLQISRSKWRVSWSCGCKAEYERRSDLTWHPCDAHARQA